LKQLGPKELKRKKKKLKCDNKKCKSNLKNRNGMLEV